MLSLGLSSHGVDIPVRAERHLYFSVNEDAHTRRPRSDARSIWSGFDSRASWLHCLVFYDRLFVLRTAERFASIVISRNVSLKIRRDRRIPLGKAEVHDKLPIVLTSIYLPACLPTHQPTTLKTTTLGVDEKFALSRYPGDRRGGQVDLIKI